MRRQPSTRAARRAPAILGVLVAGALMVGLPAPAAQAQSFNCANAGTRTEHAICANRYLSNLDSEMAAQYRNLRAVMNGVQRDGLREDQRRWLRQRNGCGGDYGCLEYEYLGRIQSLVEWRADLY